MPAARTESADGPRIFYGKVPIAAVEALRLSHPDMVTSTPQVGSAEFSAEGLLRLAGCFVAPVGWMLTGNRGLRVDSEQRENVCEQLRDLRHDLGKYVRMPLAYLPEDASVEDVREALWRALFETYQCGEKRVAAEQLWKAFDAEAPPEIRKLKSYRELQCAMGRALGWRDRLDEPSLQRTTALADLSAVGSAIDAVLDEITSECDA